MLTVFDQVQGFKADDFQTVGFIVLLELGYCLVAVDSNDQVFQCDADLGFVNDS